MIEKIINGSHLVSLDNIIQWSELDGHIKESVSQHSYKVAIFTAVLVEELFHDLATLKYKAVVSAMFHDWDEHYIKRDLSHELKYNKFNGKEIKEAIDNFAVHAAEEDLDATNQGAFILSRMFEVDPLIKKIVKVCDWLALLHHLQREADMGNSNVKGYTVYCINRLKLSVLSLEEHLKTTPCVYNQETINYLIRYKDGK